MLEEGLSYDWVTVAGILSRKDPYSITVHLTVLPYLDGHDNVILADGCHVYLAKLALAQLLLENYLLNTYLIWVAEQKATHR